MRRRPSWKRIRLARRLQAQRITALLQGAYRAKWLAYYRNWVAAKLAAGPMGGVVEDELVHLAADELRHAELLAGRIAQLGGSPPSDVRLHFQLRAGSVEGEGQTFLERVVEQAIGREQASIEGFRALCQETREADPTTRDLLVSILADDLAHLEDLVTLRADIAAAADAAIALRAADAPGSRGHLKLVEPPAAAWSDARYSSDPSASGP